MPRRLDSLARRHLNDPVRITIGREKAEPGEAPRVRQTAYVVPRAAKPAALGRILDVEAPTAAIVFCRTREEVDSLTETLNGRGYRAEALHGGMSQEQRDKVMGRLRGGRADLLVATDVAARGLDIEQLTHVVNYDVPSAPESYVHRIGRVGRAGREGVAITLAEPREHRMLKTIERVAGAPISVQQVPTVADLRARRLDLTRAALRESLLGNDLDSFRVVVETLTDEFDLMEVALAAVKLAHEAGGAVDDDEEIPQVGFRQDKDGGRPVTRHRQSRAPGPTRLRRPRRAAVRRRGPRRGHPPGRPRRGHHGGDRAEGPRHRLDRDPPAVRAGGGAGVGRRRGGPGAARHDDQGPQGHGPPRPHLSQLAGSSGTFGGTSFGPASAGRGRSCRCSRTATSATSSSGRPCHEPLEHLVEQLLQRPVGELDQGVPQPHQAGVEVGVASLDEPVGVEQDGRAPVERDHRLPPHGLVVHAQEQVALPRRELGDAPVRIDHERRQVAGVGPPHAGDAPLALVGRLLEPGDGGGGQGRRSAASSSRCPARGAPRPGPASL